MLIDTDPRVQAHINLYAVLGTLSLLVDRVPAARALLADTATPVGLRFVMPGLPRAQLSFQSTGVLWGREPKAPVVTLAFTSVAHFNRMIDGTARPIPVAAPHRLSFLTGVFAPLTELLGRYLQPAEADLADPEFRETSTILTLHVAAAALAQVANEDRSGRFSAQHIPDGDIALEVTGTLAYHLALRDHHATFVAAPSPHPRGALTFSTLEVTGGILAGDLSAIACMSDGRLAMRGVISMVDNVNRILDRVGHYLGKSA